MCIGTRLTWGFIAAIVLAFAFLSCQGAGRTSSNAGDPLEVSILAPTTDSETTVFRSPLTVAGTASAPGGGGVTQVTWSNTGTGQNGVASGTGSWSAAVPLEPGPNEITITAHDRRGQSSQAALTAHLGGSTWAWGYNLGGALGTGVTLWRGDPIAVVDPSTPSGLLEEVVQVSAGATHCLAVLQDGTVRAWGSNDYGKLGDGTMNDRPAPVLVLDPSDPTGLLQEVTAVAAGRWHSVALLVDGTVRTWGSNTDAVLGDGLAVPESTVPVQVIDLTDPSGFLTEITAISTGPRHVLALRSDTTVRAWGWNGGGAIGDGTWGGVRWAPLPVVDPSDPSGLLTNVTSIAAGGLHSLAGKTNGSAWAWGDGLYGVLGDPSVPGSLIPIQVIDPSDPSGFLSNVSAIGAGHFHSAALKGDGTVWSWGSNEAGQLGDDYTIYESPIPVQAIDPIDPTGLLQNAIGIAVSEYQSMARLSNDTLMIWGSRGGPVPTRKEDPSDPSGLLQEVAGAAAGWVSGVVRLTDGTVRTWGSNRYDQLGDGTSPRSRTQPVQTIDPFDPLGLLDGAVDIDAGRHTVALLPDGTVRAWGDNDLGQIGDGTLRTARSAPVQVLDPTDPTGFLQDVIDIDAGDASSAAVLADGSVRVWGFGELGAGISEYFSTLPLAVIDPSDPSGRLTGVVAVSASTDPPFGTGSGHFLALKTDGTVWAWGANDFGKLGDGTTTLRKSPVQVIDPTDPTGFLSDIVAIDAAPNHTLALKADGTVWACGWNGEGQLGDGTTLPRSVPARVLDPTDPTGVLTDVIAISAGVSYSMALREDGTLRAWGQNRYAQLGDGTTVDRHLPVPVLESPGSGVPFGDVQAVSACYWHTVALRTDGTVWSWGLNRDGEVGDGTFDERWTPTQVIDPLDPTGFFQDATLIAAGSLHSIAVK